jgi:cobyrinic acid a,c-diamide synthase
MIAGTNSNVGKTTFSLGIMAALTKRGLRVAPCKSGPDYIDTGFHQVVTGRPSYNLDTYLLDEETICYLLDETERQADVAIVEGVMGLFDSLSWQDSRGSSARSASVTKTPVVLAIDGSGISNSAAAMVLGFQQMDPTVEIKGVLVNRVSGEHHYHLIKEAVEDKTGIPCFGYLPKDRSFHLESRHLGLVPIDEVEQFHQNVAKLVDTVEACIDLDGLLRMARTAPVLDVDRGRFDLLHQQLSTHFAGRKIGIARDKAFTFYYQSNLDLLIKAGATLVAFSPMDDGALPEGLDALYIGGGFPEVFANELEANTPMKESLRNFLDQNGQCYAECGGYMYLSATISQMGAEPRDFLAYLPFHMEMTDRLQNFGYVQLAMEFEDGTITTKGHEFHHTRVRKGREAAPCFYNVSKERDGQITKTWGCGVHKSNTIAGYAHLMFYTTPMLVEKLL